MCGSLQLVLLVVFLVAACSAASVQRTDTEELKELLAQVRTYIEDSSHKKSTRLTAFEDVHTVLAKPDQQLDPTDGYWTNWLNVDYIWNYGTGEYEDCSRVKWQQNQDKRCYLGCSSPLAAQYGVVSKDTNATWADIESCVGPINSKASGCGFKCSNLDVMNYPKTNCDLSKCEWYGLGVNCTRCPDIRVKFFCTGTKPDENQCCPYSNGCSVEGKTGLRESLEQVEDMEERKDIISGILLDVRSALDIDEA